MTLKKSDDAISPVIGVMLMLVVTVVIAAAVTIFATGVIGETEPAPVAALDVEILNSENTLSDLKGPELFITHRSGDAVDTKDIELRFSWLCGLDDCKSGGVHYSTYSADGFKEKYPNGIDSNAGKRCQALYVKSTMVPERTEYGSGTTGNLDHYFGDVILTPGLKLTASSELLKEYENTNSQFMEMVFNEYNNSIVPGTEDTGTYTGKTNKEMGIGESHVSTDYLSCTRCNPDGLAKTSSKIPPGSLLGDEHVGKKLREVYNGGYTATLCVKAYNSIICTTCNHPLAQCTAAKDTEHTCLCYKVIPGTPGSDGIMEHLPAGTAVDVMIVHTPSGKAIYDKTVIVQ